MPVANNRIAVVHTLFEKSGSEVGLPFSKLFVSIFDSANLSQVSTQQWDLLSLFTSPKVRYSIQPDMVYQNSKGILTVFITAETPNSNDGNLSVVNIVNIDVLHNTIVGKVSFVMPNSQQWQQLVKQQIRLNEAGDRLIINSSIGEVIIDVSNSATPKVVSLGWTAQ